MKAAGKFQAPVPLLPAKAGRTRFEDLLPDLLTCLFAIWTICTNVVVFLKGTPVQLLVLFAVSAVLWIPLLLTVLSRPGLVRADSARPAAQPDGVGGLMISLAGRTRFLLRVLAFAATTGLVVVLALTGSYKLFWWLAVGGFLVAAWWNWAPAAVVAPVEDSRARLILGLITAGILVLCLCAHRPDQDDCLYLAIGSYTAENPHLAILGMDPMRIYGDLPLLFAPPRIESLYVGSGAITYLTGLEVLTIMHFIVPAIAAVVGVCAHAKLFKELLPRAWLPGVVVLQIVLLAMGEPHRAYGNFGWVRVHQGKGVFLTVLVPLLLAYGLRFGRRPDLRGFCLLAASEIASLGMTSTALWVAPIIGFLATISGAAGAKTGLRAAAASLAVLVYQAAVALHLRLELSTSGQIGLLSNRSSAEAMMDDSLQKVLGRTPLGFVSVCLALGCWSVVPRGPARRMAIVFPLAFLLLFYNPYTTAWFADQVGTYWRVFWIMPLPLLITLVFASVISPGLPDLRGRQTTAAMGSGLVLAAGWCLMQRHFFGTAVAEGVITMLRGGDFRGLVANSFALVVLITGLGYYLWRMPGVNRMGTAAIVLAVACYFVLLPGQYVLSESNRVHLGWPGPKVDGGYHPAMWICDQCAAADIILAPEDVAVWVPLRRGHPMPVISQQTWDATLVPHLGTEELSTRKLLRACVSGDVNAFSVDEFAGALRRYHLAAICFVSPIKHAPELRKVLGASGYTRGYEDVAWEVWLRRVER